MIPEFVCIALFVVYSHNALAQSEHCDAYGCGDSRSNLGAFVQLPSSEMAAILNEEKRLMQNLVNLPAAADDFRHLLILSSIAVHGSVADQHLQKEVVQVASEVRSLREKSGTTIEKFKGSSESSLEDLRRVFQGNTLDDEARSVMQKIADTASKMAESAEDLHSRSLEDGKKSQSVLEETMRVKGRFEDAKRQLKEKRSELEISKMKMEESQKNAMNAERTAKQMADEAQRAEQEARKKRKKKKKGLFKKIVHGVGKAFGHDNTKKYKEREKAAREDQRRFEEEANRQQQLYNTAKRSVEELELSISRVNENEELFDATINSLHSAVTTFSSLSVSMQKVVTFWKQMEIHCREMANPLVKKELEKLAEVDKLDDVTSEDFHPRAIHLYVQWQVLNSECMKYIEKSAATDDEVARYIQQSTSNPTEAKTKISQLNALLH